MKFTKLTLALLAAALIASAASAQQPYPYANYNRDRAYHHFLTSPAAVKTYSAAQPGRVWGYDTPFESVRTERTPAYYREYVSPYRHEVYDVPSRYVETTVRRPVVVYPSPVVAYPRYAPGPVYYYR